MHNKKEDAKSSKYILFLFTMQKKKNPVPVNTASTNFLIMIKLSSNLLITWFATWAWMILLLTRPKTVFLSCLSCFCPNVETSFSVYLIGCSLNTSPLDNLFLYFWDLSTSIDMFTWQPDGWVIKFLKTVIVLNFKDYFLLSYWIFLEDLCTICLLICASFASFSVSKNMKFMDIV